MITPTQNNHKNELILLIRPLIWTCTARITSIFIDTFLGIAKCYYYVAIELCWLKYVTTTLTLQLSSTPEVASARAESQIPTPLRMLREHLKSHVRCFVGTIKLEWIPCRQLPLICIYCDLSFGELINTKNDSIKFNRIGIQINWTKGRISNRDTKAYVLIKSFLSSDFHSMAVNNENYYKFPISSE